MLEGDGRSYSWRGFDHPASITRGATIVSFQYGAEQQRIRQTTPGGLTHYYTDAATGARSERSLSLAVAHVAWTDYVAAGSGIALTIRTTDISYSHSSTNVTRSYLHRDHLGSTTMVTDAAGAVVQRMDYDPWGKRRFTGFPINPPAPGAADPTGSLEASGLPNRGFTDHEHIEELGLVHMNGRLYDPLIARFISADPIIADPLSVQAFNRYSYVDNNPLTYTDPTGYLKLSSIVRVILSPITIIPGVKNLLKNDLFAAVYQAGAAYFGGPIGAAAAAATIASARGGSLGDMFKAAVIAYVTAEAFRAVGDITGHGKLPFLSADHIGNIAGHAVVGCASAAAGGGKCGAGALAAGFGSFAGPVIPSGWGPVGNMVAQMVIGGVGAELGGGKFTNGAVTAAFGYLFNEMDGYWDNQVVPEGGEEPALLREAVGLAPGVDLIAAAVNPEATGLDWAVGVAGVVPGGGKSLGAVFKGIKYAKSIRIKALLDPVGHNFPYSFDEVILASKPIVQSDKTLLYSVPGQINSKVGHYTMVVRPDTNTVIHRAFQETYRVK